MDFLPNPQQRALQEVLTAAAERLDSGQFDEALKALRSRGGFALENPVGKNILGEIHLQQGKAAEALRDFDAAIKLVPNFAEAHANRGAALLDLKRPLEALEAERRALRFKAGLPLAHFNQGIALAALKRTGEAVEAFAAAIKARPGFAEAYLNRGMALIEVERPLEALGDFRKAQALQPTLLTAYLAMGRAFRILGQREDALAAAERALALAPDDTRALTFKATALMGLEMFPTALPIIDGLIARDSSDGQLHIHRFGALRGLRRFDEALAEAHAAIDLAPTDPEGYAVLAVALSDLNRIEDAADALTEAERLGATSDGYFHVRATLMSELGDLEEARAAYRRALQIEPNKATYHYHHGMFLLATGAYDKGWAEHEWRLKDSQYAGVERLTFAPRWQGEDIAGKRILVLREQGSGDTIQFARFIPELARRGAKPTFLAPPALTALVRRSLVMADVTDTLGVRGAFDYQVPVLSLPNALNVSLADLPGPIPYLFADPARIEKWRPRIGSEGFKVGVVWQGNPKYFRDPYRSVPLRYFAPLAAIPGVRLISLQAIFGLDQLKSLPEGMRVETYGDEIANNPDGFEEIAGLMADLDLIVTSDTVTAHLAGALGRPTWTALRHRPDWRWMQQRADSPWYPTMRLFRQPEHANWTAVFDAIASALREKVAGG